MTTNVPAPSFGVAGFVAPAESTILTGVQADQQAAFGGNLNPSLTTPQGQLAQSTTAIIGEANNQFLALANGVDPAYAAGRMQDAIGRIYYITRNPAQSTVVTATCTGLFGTVIPIGAQARDQAGNIYLCTAAGTIPVGGSISLPFACAITGAISAPIGYVNTIYQAIPGWDSITNAAAGVIGNDVESRADFEYRRKNSVAINAQGSLPAIYAAVFNVANVIDVFCYENNTNAAVLYGATNYSVAPHSIYVAAVGGISTAIAQAIWTKKNTGCDYNGNTSVTVTDTSGYSIPYPTYPVKYETPSALPILFAVQITNSTLLPSDIVSLVQTAIINAFYGVDGGQRARIASTIFASRYYAPVSLISPAVSIISILIGTSTATLNSVSVGIDQTPTVTASNISVTLV